MLLTREQLQERLFALHRASLELVKDVSLDHLPMSRIKDQHQIPHYREAPSCNQVQVRLLSQGSAQLVQHSCNYH